MRKSSKAPAVSQKSMESSAKSGMRAAPSNQSMVPADQFFQAQQDFVSGVPYQGQPTPGVKRGAR